MVGKVLNLNIKREVKQGRIKEIPLSRVTTQQKVAQYADDLSLTLRGELGIVLQTIFTLSEFILALGLTLNREKSSAY